MTVGTRYCRCESKESLNNMYNLQKQRDRARSKLLARLCLQRACYRACRVDGELSSRVWLVGERSCESEPAVLVKGKEEEKCVCHVSLFSIFLGKTCVDARGCRLNFVRDAQRGDDDDLRVHRYKRVGIQKASAL